MNIFDITVTGEDSGKRIDSYLAECTELSRTRIKNLTDSGKITVNGLEIKSNYKIKSHDNIKVDVPPPEDLQVEAEDIPLDILYEDESVIVVNKPKGMVVHPANGNEKGTMVNALLFLCRDRLSDINGVIRPGILHRIDKDTTGILVVAKNNEAHRFLAEKFKKHDIKREYTALVHGVLEHSKGTIDINIARDKKDRKKMTADPLGKKNAITHFEVIERFDNYTLVKLTLETGRTHQIRTHMKYIGHPVVGDEVYGRRKCEFETKGQMLHAGTLGFEHPETHEYMIFTSELPQYFKDILNKIKDEKLLSRGDHVIKQGASNKFFLQEKNLKA